MLGPLNFPLCFKRGPGSAQSRHDRPDGHSQQLGGFRIGEAQHANQMKNFRLFRRHLRERLFNVGQFGTMLLRRRRRSIGQISVRGKALTVGRNAACAGQKVFRTIAINQGKSGRELS